MEGEKSEFGYVKAHIYGCPKQGCDFTSTWKSVRIHCRRTRHFGEKCPQCGLFFEDVNGYVLRILRDIPSFLSGLTNMPSRVGIVAPRAPNCFFRTKSRIWRTKKSKICCSLESRESPLVWEWTTIWYGPFLL